MKLSEFGWLAMVIIVLFAGGMYTNDRNAARKHEFQMAQLQCPVTDTIPQEKR